MSENMEEFNKLVDELKLLRQQALNRTSNPIRFEQEVRETAEKQLEIMKSLTELCRHDFAFANNLTSLPSMPFDKNAIGNMKKFVTEVQEILKQCADEENNVKELKEVLPNIENESKNISTYQKCIEDAKRFNWALKTLQQNTESILNEGNIVTSSPI